MTNPIAEEAQKLEQDPKVILFQLDATKFGGEVLYFTASVSGGQAVSFGGNEYTPLPIAAEGFSWVSGGALPRPTLTVASNSLALISLLINSNDLVGCEVRRIKTYSKFLDNGETPNKDAIFPPDYFLVEKKAQQNKTRIQFELSSEMDQQGRLIPARQVLRDSCSHRYRYWNGTQFVYKDVTCPYVGAAMFDRAGNPTTDPKLDRCGKHISDCSVRFGATAVLPTYAYPGVGRL